MATKKRFLTANDQPISTQIYTSFEEVTDAYNKVRDELIALGLLWRRSKLDKVQCFYERVAPVSAVTGRLGYFNEDKNDRNIHFPSLFLPFGWLLGRRYEKSIPVDVLRHEFGHALATLYPRALSQGDLFLKAFGGVYGPKPAPEIDRDNWEFDCVSEYAASATREDFAETFMLFVKYKGKIPAQFKGKPVILKKWKAVAEIVKRVSAASR
jgi:hypothetical protein